MTSTQPTSKGHIAIERARLGSDAVVLAATFVFFFFLTCGYFVVSFLQTIDLGGDSNLLVVIVGLLVAGVMGALFMLAILFFGMIIVRMQRQMMLGNSLQVEYSDYAWLREWANEVSADLELPRVEIFVTQDPYINAYAFGFIKPYTIVLHSGSIRYLTHDELKVVVVHEMAHIKYGHTTAMVYLMPFLSVPVLSALFGWIAGFWQRRTELTADRLALMYIADSELVKASLIKVHVGPDVAKSMNDVARQWLQYTAERPMNRFAQTFSSHPFLVRRLSHIDKWKYVIEPAVASNATPSVASSDAQ